MTFKNDQQFLIHTRIILSVICFVFFTPASYAFDPGTVSKELKTLGIKNPLEATGIDLENITDYLDWEQLAVSVKADMINTTEILGRTVHINSVLYKKDITGIRIDVRGDLQVPDSATPLKLVNCSLLRFPLKEKAYLLIPLKKGYMALDPEKSREMLGELKEKFDKKSGTIEKKEKLGEEELDGVRCDKVHVIFKTAGGIKNDITSWLSPELKGFPLKILLRYETPRGITSTSTTLFKNIIKTEPDGALFEIPGDYEEYDTMLELATEGRRGSRLKKPKRRLLNQ